MPLDDQPDSSRRTGSYDWDGLGIVKPSIVVDDDPSLPRLYSFNDVLKLRVAAEMRKRHWLPTQIREAMSDLEQRGFYDPLATVTFIAPSVGGQVLWDDPSSDTPMSAKHSGQKALPLDLDMQDLRTGLVAKISELTKRSPGQVVRLRAVLGSQPIIAGTRIPVEKIVLLHRQGIDADGIVAALPSLTRADVDAALEYDARRREQRTA